MSLRDETTLLLGTDTAANSLPDPTTVNGATRFLVNEGTATVVWSSTGATPFTEGGVNVATISILRGQFKVVQSDGTHWIVAPDVPLIPIVTTPARAFGIAFTPSLTRPVLGLYTVRISAITTLLGGGDGQIELRADAGAPATVRAQSRNSMTQTLGVTVGTMGIQDSELSFLFPAGWQGVLATVTNGGAPTFLIVRQTEIIL